MLQKILRVINIESKLIKNRVLAVRLKDTCGVLTPPGSWAPLSHSLILPQWDGRENWKGKTLRSRWRQVNKPIGQASKQTNKTTKIHQQIIQNQSLITSSLMPSQSSNNGNFRKAIIRVSLLNMTIYSMEYLFVHFGSAVLVVSPASLLTGWQSEKQKSSLMLFKHCSAIAKRLECSQCCFCHQSKTKKKHMGCYEETEICPNQTQYNCPEVASGLGSPDILDCWKVDPHFPFLIHFWRTCSLLLKKEG